jgi:glycosyltransferase involved in cell wall biosynthesis
MTIAVALATYNGSRFLKEQLTSLLQQTRKPDHVVISDDVSSDDTVAVAEDFRRIAPFRVDVLAGRRQLGVLGNFLWAAQACEAEYIAFCDQDDIWLPQKLEICEQALKLTNSLAIIHSIKQFRESVSGTLSAVSLSG